jgi:hypothetical protein
MPQILFRYAEVLAKHKPLEETLWERETESY